ncbi:WD40-repeat-containing domain protein [Pelagophyceae sp. CCMP2097]|nr:WD40-repeat-containing domain protein [Pelagophyceae sp. CCMP2097]
MTGALIPSAKRQRVEATATSASSLALSSGASAPSALWDEDDEDKRTSNLDAPIMLLTGHAGAINAFKFSPGGEHAASGGAERSIYLWEVFGDCSNYNILEGHKNAVVDVQWCDKRTLVSASADKTIMLWDAHLGKRKKKFAGHTGFVNSVCPARNEAAIVSGGDDGNILLWDQRVRTSVHALKAKYAVTSVAFSDDAQCVFSGGVDEVLSCWDLRKDEVLYTLQCHRNTVTGLALSPDGTMLLSNAMDAKLHCWDVRPYASGDRLLKTFVGHQHDFHKNLLSCAWSPDNEKVTCGSSDQMVHIWDVATTEEVYHLPGHKGCVNDVHFHPSEPIVGSCSADKTIYLGELAS